MPLVELLAFAVRTEEFFKIITGQTIPLGVNYFFAKFPYHNEAVVDPAFI
jgi:hypothetical protein